MSLHFTKHLAEPHSEAIINGSPAFRQIINKVFKNNQINCAEVLNEKGLSETERRFLISIIIGPQLNIFKTIIREMSKILDEEQSKQCEAQVTELTEAQKKIMTFLIDQNGKSVLLKDLLTMGYSMEDVGIVVDFYPSLFKAEMREDGKIIIFTDMQTTEELED